jgi:acyl carrier protein
MENKKVEETVWETLESILLCSRNELSPSASLVDDLKIHSDDLSFIFVPELEKKLRVKIPVEEWDNVYTIQNAIDLLNKYKAKTS